MTAQPLDLETGVASVTVKTDGDRIELTSAMGWDYDGVDLTPAEARMVARALLSHATDLDGLRSVVVTDGLRSVIVTDAPGTRAVPHPPTPCRHCLSGVPHRHQP